MQVAPFARSSSGAARHRTRLLTTRTFSILTAGLAASSHLPAGAATVRWSNPNGPFDWGNPENWSGSALPTAADTALFDTPFSADGPPPVIELGAHRTVGALEILTGGGVAITLGSPADASAGHSLVTGSVSAIGPTPGGASHTIAADLRLAGEARLQVANGGALRFEGATSIAAGGLRTDDGAGNITFAGDITLGNGAAIRHRGAGTSLTLAGRTDLAGGGLVVGHSPSFGHVPITLSGPVSGTGSWEIGGNVSLVSSASHPFAGFVGLSGVADLSADNALGTGELEIRHGAIRNTDSVPHRLAHTLLLAADSTFGGPGSSDLTFTSRGAVRLGRLELLNDGDRLFTLTIEGPSPGGVHKVGPGTLVLRGAGTPSSTFGAIVTDGELRLGYSPPPAAGGYLSAYGTGRITLTADDQAAGAGRVPWTLADQGVIDFNGHTNSRAEILFAAFITAGNSMPGGGPGAGALHTGPAGKLRLIPGAAASPAEARIALDPTATATALLTGNVEIAAPTVLFDIADGTETVDMRVQAAVTGAGGLTKRGAGTLALSGPLSHAGPTRLQEGTLLVNGSLSQSPLTVSPGTTLGGFGSVISALIVPDGATLAPGEGSGSGTLSTGPLTLSANARLLYDLGAPGSVDHSLGDRISVTGDLILDGVLDLRLGPFFTGHYTLFTYTGALTDRGLLVSNAPFAYVINTSAPGRVTLTAIPEPGCAVLVPPALALLGRRRLTPAKL